MEDDSIYFSSARELAQGHGYVMPNIPGTPPATKYPILYPWMLSWIWRLNPNFPANLNWAVALNAVFGFIYLSAAFVFLRSFKGLGVAPTLILTAFCAVHPVILVLSAELMSDIPFASFALAACALASKAIEKKASEKIIVLSGILSGLSILTRTLGIPVALGLFVAIVVLSGWRKSLVFAGTVSPFIAFLIGRSILIKPAVAAIAMGPCASSWRMTWLYYTSYTAYWKADVISNHVLWEILKNGIWTAFIQPGSYFVDPTGVRPALIAVVLLVFLSAVAIRGSFRQVQSNGWQPIHFALLLYLLPLLLWDYANFERFLIPFLPLLAAGMWVEGQHLAGQIRHSIRGQSGAEAIFAVVFFCLIGCALLLGTALTWRHGTKLLARNSQSRATMLVEKKQAYEWLRENTQADARVLAYEDGSSFLYSNRRAIRPIILSPAGYYRREILDSEVACINSSAEPVRASYWIVSDDDFKIEWAPARARARAKEEEMEATLRPLFRSSQGRVRIYGLESESQTLR